MLALRHSPSVITDERLRRTRFNMAWDAWWEVRKTLKPHEEWKAEKLKAEIEKYRPIHRESTIPEIQGSEPWSVVPFCHLQLDVDCDWLLPEDREPEDLSDLDL